VDLPVARLVSTTDALARDMRIARATELGDGRAWTADAAVLGAEATKVVVAGNNAVHVGVGAVRGTTACIKEHGEFVASC
jgi:hypothetical protein